MGSIFFAKPESCYKVFQRASLSVAEVQLSLACSLPLALSSFKKAYSSVMKVRSLLFAL